MFAGTAMHLIVLTIACIALLLVLCTGGWRLNAAGFVTGFGQFNKIADNASAGRQQLFEWDLFLSPANNVRELQHTDQATGGEQR